MNDFLLKMNFDEINYYYKSPKSLVNYSLMQSFSIIKSCIEVFAYYEITEFKAIDVKIFFEKLQLVQERNHRIFVPSEKKIIGVINCLPQSKNNIIVFDKDKYIIKAWDISGYKAEIELAYYFNRIQ